MLIFDNKSAFGEPNFPTHIFRRILPHSLEHRLSMKGSLIGVPPLSQQIFKIGRPCYLMKQFLIYSFPNLFG